VPPLSKSCHIGLRPVVPLDIMILAVSAGIAAGSTWLCAAFARSLLLRHRILDNPGTRSSHCGSVPRGGGIALVSVILIGWAALSALGLDHMRQISVITSMALLIAIVSWFDDISNLSVISRLSAQTVVVTISMLLIPTDFMLLGFLAHPLGMIVVGIGWIWFMNVFNFMDGIDGITGVETISICAGIALTLGFLGSESYISSLAIIVAASTLGFLSWNWHPAKLFLGDVGSIPLGFLLGWLLFSLAREGEWAAALILPSYYLVDASLTLIDRAIRLEPVWKAHRQHFYQRAVAGQLSHSQATRAIIITNIWLIACALVSTIIILPGLIGAFFGIVALLCYFRLVSQSVGP